MSTLPSAVFFGTPELAAIVLDRLAGSGIVKIDAVVTQLDKPSGRGQKLQPSPVKQLATKLEIPVFQPKSLRKDAEDFFTWLKSVERPTVFIVVAYGLIIPPSLIEYPQSGIINVHLSLLPRWRGAAPIQRAIMAGDTSTGVSIMKIDEGLDTGPVYSTREVAVSPKDDTGSLTEKLAKLGADELLEKLPQIFAGFISPKPQPELGATYAEKITKEELAVDWNQPADQIARNIRGLSPAPGARAFLRGELCKLFQAAAILSTAEANTPGAVIAVDRESITVRSGEQTALKITEMQLPGKKRLPVAEILKSSKIQIGEKFV